MFTLIVAKDQQGNIGKKGWMPWHLPEDLKLFKARTLNHTIVMGKTTFLGIGKPLPQRRMLVVTHDETLSKRYEGIETIHDFVTFLETNRNIEEEIFICGGAEIYRQALPYCSKMVITEVEGVHDADISFPPYYEKEFMLTSETAYEGFTVKIYDRKDQYV